MKTLADFKRLSFAHLPTPLERLDHLSRHLGGPTIYIKRDDCTGLATGGNKARKLEFLMADAIDKGCDTVITAGAVQSNHARQTAAIAAKLQLGCVLALENRTNSTDRGYLESGNVFLDRLFDAQIKQYPGGTDMPAVMESIADELKTAGKRPYIIPGGGSNPIGALGYVNCAFEIVEQIKEQDLDIDMVVHATGSAGTQAGLLVGFELADLKLPVLGISTRLPQKDQEEKVYKLVKEMADFLQIRKEIDRSVVRANSDYVGKGYGIPTQGMLEAVSALAQWEGILLDPVYSGKGMHGLIDLIANKSAFNKDQNILFLHTGGNVGLFGYLNEFEEAITPPAST